jgi:hypothetical protein
MLGGRTRTTLAFTLAVSCVFTGATQAAGPMLVNGVGEPLVWTARPIPFNPDRNTLGSLGNLAAVAAVTANFSVWSGVATASLDFVNAGSLPVDVTVANWANYIAVCDGLSEIVFDTDGRIIDDIFGVGASNDILGFAGPACGTYVPAVITEGTAVLNGKWLDGVVSLTNPEMPLAEFNGVFVHEFGHYLNLDHSQVNLAEAFDGLPGNDAAIATMFPFAVKGAAATTLHLDDRVSASMLYPAPSFLTGFGALSGRVLRANGATPFQGAYVVARRLGNPRHDAVGVASGARYFAGGEGGPPPESLRGLYEIPGLPPGDYLIELEEIHAMFSGSSSVGPVDPPVRLPGEPEFYNGAAEAATNPPDDPTEFVPVTVSAGTIVEGLDFLINAFPPPPNDACVGARVIPALPFTDIVDTRGATTVVSDPLQACTFGGPNQNSSSVWYLLTSTAEELISVSTLGSDYDTILSAYSGHCSRTLTQVACNDDWGGTLQSKITVHVTPDSPTLIEVTSIGSTGGGTLVLGVTSAMHCTPAPKTECRNASQTKARVVYATSSESDQILWRWKAAGGVSPFDFADPSESTDYALCVYDTAFDTPVLALTVLVPAGGICNERPCWRRHGWTSFRYADPRRTRGPLSKVSLKASLTGAAKILLKGAGPRLRVPDSPLVKQDRVIVQLVNSAGVCWDAEYRKTLCSAAGSAGLGCAYSP